MAHADAGARRRYFFTRNMATIVAFAVGKKYTAGNGVYMLGAHTDSPCLKLKPNSKGTKSGYLTVNCETYGGGLWSTWFDRDLSVAGRVLLRAADGSLQHKLVRCRARSDLGYGVCVSSVPVCWVMARLFMALVLCCRAASANQNARFSDVLSLLLS